MKNPHATIIIENNACSKRELAAFLADAKTAHTRWEDQFHKQGVPVPAHRWENWYADYIVARLNADGDL